MPEIVSASNSVPNTNTTFESNRTAYRALSVEERASFRRFMLASIIFSDVVTRIDSAAERIEFGCSMKESLVASERDDLLINSVSTTDELGVRLALSLGANVETVDKDGKTALTKSIESSNIGLILLLLYKEASVSGEDLALAKRSFSSDVLSLLSRCSEGSIADRVESLFDFTQKQNLHI